MENSFKSIVLLLTTQAMMNLGEVADPVSNEKSVNLENASLFISLLKILKDKTDGNLTEDENFFLKEALSGLENIKKKHNK